MLAHTMGDGSEGQRNSVPWRASSSVKDPLTIWAAPKTLSQRASSPSNAAWSEKDLLGISTISNIRPSLSFSNRSYAPGSRVKRTIFGFGRGMRSITVRDRAMARYDSYAASVCRVILALYRSPGQSQKLSPTRPRTGKVKKEKQGRGQLTTPPPSHTSSPTHRSSCTARRS